MPVEHSIYFPLMPIPEVNGQKSLLLKPTFAQIIDHADGLQRHTVLIPRAKVVQEQYIQFKRSLVNEGVSLDEYIRGRLNGQKYTILPNDFPVELDDNPNVGAEHYTLWLPDQKAPIKEVDNYISHWLEKMELTPEEIIFLRRPRSLQSIPNLLHIHLYALKKH